MTQLDKDRNETLDWMEFKKYLQSEEYAKETFLKFAEQLLQPLTK